jgi:hypothetical protein
MGAILLTIVFIVVFLVDACLYEQGHDGLFFAHKTEAELEIQRIKIEALKRRLEKS